jgi:hypothetical protein
VREIEQSRRFLFLYLHRDLCIEELQTNTNKEHFLWPKHSKIDAHTPNARVPLPRASNTVARLAPTQLRAAAATIVVPVHIRSAQVQWRLK